MAPTLRLSSRPLNKSPTKRLAPYRRLALALAVTLVLVLVAAVGVLFSLDIGYNLPGPSKKAVVVIIPKGASSARIAAILDAAGIISDARVFRLGLRLFGQPGPLRAGEFIFPAHLSAAGTVGILQSGRTVVRRFTAAEGLSNAEIAAKLASAPGLTGAVGALPDEGKLLPETYHYAFGDARKAVLKRMSRSMTALLNDMWPKRAKGLPLKSPQEALILASIVEKETGIESERPRVAAVFINRLKRGMRLQSDPTVIYGMTFGRRDLGRSLTRNDLRKPTPYNTYIIKGLPAGAIANPGRAALRAVLHPALSDELYFVADGSGGHAFATTLKGHNSNAAKWRKLRRQKKGAAN